MKILIITGGDVDEASAAGFLKTYDFSYVIAVDGGLASCEKLGLVPDCIVGDFDTVDSGLLEEYKSKGIHLETHKPEKDYTDTELALMYGLELAGAEEIVILGALGKRFDHALGNIQILLHGLKRKIPCRIVDAYNCMYLLNEGRSFYRKDIYGKYISLIPFTETVTGITLEGFKYPLYEAVFVQGNSLGISNELTGECATMTMREGILICVESKD